MNKKSLDRELDDLLSDADLPDNFSIKEETRRLRLSESIKETFKKSKTQENLKNGQLKRKNSGWNQKMIGNKNSQGNQNTLGMKHSEETKRRISESMKGVIHHTLIGVPKPKETCPHCGKIGGRPQMLQYHFDRCKFKEQST